MPVTPQASVRQCGFCINYWKAYSMDKREGWFRNAAAVRFGRLWLGRSGGFSVCVLEFVLSVFRLEEGSPVWVIGWRGGCALCDARGGPQGAPSSAAGPGVGRQSPSSDGAAGGRRLGLRGLCRPAPACQRRAPCPGGTASAVSSARPAPPVAVRPASSGRDHVERPATGRLEGCVGFQPSSLLRSNR